MPTVVDQVNFADDHQITGPGFLAEPMLAAGSGIAISTWCARVSRMGHATAVQQVRELVQQQFQGLNVSTEAGIEETILIRNGFYCGRRFAVAQAHAIWFCEEDQLKLYGPDGAVIGVLRNIQQRFLRTESPLSDAA